MPTSIRPTCGAAVALAASLFFAACSGPVEEEDDRVEICTDCGVGGKGDLILDNPTSTLLAPTLLCQMVEGPPDDFISDTRWDRLECQLLLEEPFGVNFAGVKLRAAGGRLEEKRVGMDAPDGTRVLEAQFASDASKADDGFWTYPLTVETTIDYYADTVTFPDGTSTGTSYVSRCEIVLEGPEAEPSSYCSGGDFELWRVALDGDEALDSAWSDKEHRAATLRAEVMLDAISPDICFDRSDPCGTTTTVVSAAPWTLRNSGGAPFELSAPLMIVVPVEHANASAAITVKVPYNADGTVVPITGGGVITVDADGKTSLR